MTLPLELLRNRHPAGALASIERGLDAADDASAAHAPGEVVAELEAAAGQRADGHCELDAKVGVDAAHRREISA